MKTILFLLLPLTLISCAATKDADSWAVFLLTKGAYSNGKSRLVSDPTGIIKEAGQTVRTYLMWDGIKYMVGSLMDFAAIREQAVLTGKLKEFELVAQQQGFTHELNMLKAAPMEAAPIEVLP